MRNLFASILPISDYNKNAQGQQIVRSTARQPDKILALNKWLKDYAAANKHVYLDYFSATVDEKGFLKADLANDGLHPHALVELAVGRQSSDLVAQVIVVGVGGRQGDQLRGRVLLNRDPLVIRDRRGVDGRFVGRHYLDGL